MIMMRWDRMSKRKARDLFITMNVCGLVLFALIFSSMSTVRAAGPTPVSVNPSSQTVNASDTFTVTVECVPQQPVKAFELKLSFNPSLVRATSVAEGDLFEGYQTFFNGGEIDNSAGRIINMYNLIVGPGTVTGNGSLVDHYVYGEVHVWDVCVEPV